MNYEHITRTGLSINFTLAQVIGYLRAIAIREPDRIGQGEGGSCIYATVDGHTVTPVCIVGQMFADLGLLRLLLSHPNDLTWGESRASSCGLGAVLWETLAPFGVTADDDAASFMRLVQSRQDGGEPWGQAFDSAVEDWRKREQDALNMRLDNLFA